MAHDMRAVDASGSHVAEVGHCPETGTARVKFGTGRVYEVSPAEAHECEAMRTHPNPGKYYNEVFKARSIKRIE